MQRQKSNPGRSVGNPQAIRKDGCRTKSDAAQGVPLLQKYGESTEACACFHLAEILAVSWGRRYFSQTMT